MVFNTLCWLFSKFQLSFMTLCTTQLAERYSLWSVQQDEQCEELRLFEFEGEMSLSTLEVSPTLSLGYNKLYCEAIFC